MKYDLLRCGRPGARTVVLVSGLGGAAGYWAPHVASLSAEVDLVLYDQAGTGANARDLGGTTSIAAMADDVLAICDDAGIDRFDLVGHALGGLVGLDLACRPDNRLDRLVAINAWPEIDAHTARCFDIRLNTLAGQGLEAFVALQQNFLYPPFWIAAHPEKIAAEEAHAAAHFQGAANLAARIGALRDFRLGDWPSGDGDGATQVLLLCSTDDALVDVAQSHRLKASIHGARLIEYPQGGHALNLTCQARFDADLRDFLIAS
ncbi:pyrimidine utilization protein D [Marinibacterium sp. SX1]|uniref:pyrimidine utilization protein D n=1 Tax=Marinibacterium sp. SX1 TaxID=3388424 RepID=UPI003D172FA9